MPQRQEVVNVVLAQLLCEHGLVAAPEQIIKAPSTAIRLPDVILDFLGVRLAVEAEFIDASGAAAAAYEKAQSRVEQGLAHIGVAVLYPAKLRNTPFEKLKTALRSASLRYSITTEATTPAVQLQLFGQETTPITWYDGPVESLIESLRLSHGSLIREDVLDRAVARLDAALGDVVTAIEWQPATSERMALQLGVRDLPSDGGRHSRLGSMTLKQKYAINRVASLILVNAMIFQEVLSRTDSRVVSLGRIRRDSSIVATLTDHWAYILGKINYFPIFYTAHELLTCFSSDEAVTRGITKLCETALSIVECKAALRHDLAGRIYHRLLQEAKYLGAYYTSIPSATMLLKLALRHERLSCDWSDAESIAELRIADLSCGTGTLLMAAADALVDNYIHECVAQQKMPQMDDLHAAIVEKVIYGYDVLPSALHLTASTLALRVPDKPINASNLFTMPLGGNSNALGTLDFLEANTTPATLFSDVEQFGGTGPIQRDVSIPELDLCVMNPPFTRSVGGNLLFGNLPADERDRMQTKLKRMVKQQNASASITAGLGSVFVALGDRKIKPGGTLALVLPRAVLSGVAWEPTRRLVENNYWVEYIVVSHAPDHWNFSENTQLSETLFVARKTAEKKTTGDKRTVYVNLWKQPATPIEGLAIAQSVITQPAPSLESGPSCTEIKIGTEKYGEAYSVDWSNVRDRLWSWPCTFAQIELNRILYFLLSSHLRLPHSKVSHSLPLVPLGQIAALGFDRRDIHDGFNLASGRTAFPAIWGHDSYSRTRLVDKPNAWLQPLDEAKPGRPQRDAEHLWTKASRLLITERMRLTTMRMLAMISPHRVLSNTWWPVLLKQKVRRAEMEKILCLWLNSTLGIITLMGERVETQGAWIEFKKPILENCRVLDVYSLDGRRLKPLLRCFDSVSKKDLMPIPALDKDDTRGEIDEALCSALGLPDLSDLREMLAHEPILSAKIDSLDDDDE
jgi:hypothetical protein